MRKGEQTRQEIIRKAAPIFNQKGYDGAALSDLMRATGLEKGGIYRHFASKEELAAEAFDYAWGETFDSRIDNDDGNSVLRARARKALNGWRSYIISIVREGIKAGEIRAKTDAEKLATLMISSLEGAVMVYRLERDEEPLRSVRAHLENYLEREVRAASK